MMIKGPILILLSFLFLNLSLSQKALGVNARLISILISISFSSFTFRRFLSKDNLFNFSKVLFILISITLFIYGIFIIFNFG